MVMLRVALTGGIGTGKSAVLGWLRESGVPVIEADAVAHRLMAAGTAATAAIAARFGPGVLAADGSTNRRSLGALVFADEGARRELEQILHPAIYAAIEDWMTARASDGVPLAVAEIPLLFETGHEADFDRIVVTTCEEAEQVRRIVARGGDDADARRRMAVQWPLADKVRRAHLVISTDGSLSDSRSRTEAVLSTLRADAAERQD